MVIVGLRKRGSCQNVVLRWKDWTWNMEAWRFRSQLMTHTASFTPLIQVGGAFRLKEVCYFAAQSTM